jgi:hypothetical protein
MIKVDIREAECENLGWNHLAHFKFKLKVFVNTVMRIWVR